MSRKKCYKRSELKPAIGLRRHPLPARMIQRGRSVSTEHSTTSKRFIELVHIGKEDAESTSGRDGRSGARRRSAGEVVSETAGRSATFTRTSVDAAEGAEQASACLGRKHDWDFRQRRCSSPVSSHFVEIRAGGARGGRDSYGRPSR